MFPMKKQIHVSDRATKMLVIRNTNAFSIGIDLTNFNQDLYFRNQTPGLTAIPFRDQPDQIIVGYITRNGHLCDELAQQYLELLRSHIERLVPPGTDLSVL